jgi:hypothetical protein
MAFMRMYEILPELALDETRTITVFANNEYNLPPSNYGLVEMYCNDENCDCRRVFLDVVSSELEKSVAYIAYGWESSNYYAEWFFGKQVDATKLRGDDLQTVKHLKGPCLNAGNPQSKLAPAILKIVTELVLSNKSYIDRLKRHYKLFREKVDEHYRNHDNTFGASTGASTRDSKKTVNNNAKPTVGPKEILYMPTVSRDASEKKSKPHEPAPLEVNKKGASVPKAMSERYTEIAEIIGSFCDEKLNDEYKEICLKALAKLCRKRPSPINTGKANTWACGIVYAIGSNNFIFDKSQPLSMTATEIAGWFGLAKSTAGSKAAEINKLLKLSYVNTEFMLEHIMDNNSMIWYLSIDGYVFDIRQMPREIQEEAFNLGLIPYIPADRE